LIASLVLLALQAQLMPSANATHLDGKSFGYTKEIRFEVRKRGKTDVWFTFKLPLLGSGIAFGDAGPSTFALIDAGINDGSPPDDDLHGIYGPKPHANGDVEAQDHKDLAELDNDSRGDIRVRIQEALETKLEDKKDQPCAVVLDLLDVPALTIDTDAEGRVIMDLPGLKLVGPAACDGNDWDLKVRANATRTKGTELPPTGSSAASTTAKGVLIAVVSVVVLAAMRRRLEAF
jgi:hypothetical protein